MGVAKSMGLAVAAFGVVAAVEAAGALPQATSSPATTTANTASTSPAKSYELDLNASKQWIDTRIDLRAAEKLHITAMGKITYPANDASKSPAKSFGPDGLSRGWADLIHQYAVPDGGHGALIGRLGSGDAAQPFLLGATSDYQAPVVGRLFLGINQSQKDAGGASGAFHVVITVTDPGLSTAEAAVAAVRQRRASLRSRRRCSTKFHAVSPIPITIRVIWSTS
jgi:hypothetical protein